MINTSAAYKVAIKADTETTRLQAKFGFIPDGAQDGVSVSSNTESEYSQISQLNNGVEQQGKIAMAEVGRTILDGSFAFVDDVAEVGYLSGYESGADRTFAEPKPYIDYVMASANDIIGVTLFFDVPGNEWATSVTISYYNSSDALIQSQTFENTKSIAAIEYPASGVKRIRATMNEWSLPYRIVKACEMLPGEVFIFDPSNTFSFEFTEQIQPFKSSIEFPQFTVTFDNSDKKFDIVNPSGLTAYLRQLMKVYSKLGVLTGSIFEYVDVGKFFVYEWPDDTQEDEASLTCRPEMAFKENLYYVSAGVGMQTVAQAAAIIFSIAGITNYTVDSSLQSITVNQYIGEEVPLLNAMGQLAVAAGGYWKFNRDGSYSLLPYAIPTASNSIDYDNMWTKPTIRQGKKITSVNVKYYTYNATDKRLEDTDKIITASTNDGSTAEDITSCFIADATRATAIGNLALSYYAMRLNYNVSYRGDMSIEAGDTISVENDYGTSNVFVLRHSLTWDAEEKLSGSFSGIGGV